METPYRILLVNDDSFTRGILTRFILHIYPTAQVAHAGDGHAGLATFTHDGADLIITDCMMPIMDGATFVRCVRDQQNTTPILAISGSPHLADGALDAGASSFLALPFTLADFRAMLHALLPSLPT